MRANSKLRHLYSELKTCSGCFIFRLFALYRKSGWCVFRGFTVSRIRAFTSMVLFSISIPFRHLEVEKCVPYHDCEVLLLLLLLCAHTRLCLCVISQRGAQMRLKVKKAIDEHIHMRRLSRRVALSVSSQWLCCWYFCLLNVFFFCFWVFFCFRRFNCSACDQQASFICATVARCCTNNIDNRFSKLSYFFFFFSISLII